METDNVVLEHLRKLRGEMAELKSGQREIVEILTSMRMRMLADETDDMVRDRRVATLEAEMDQVRRRLELID